MNFPSVFTPQTNADLRDRIHRLTPETQPQWGKMNVAQMLAHCNVTYDVTYGKTPVSYNWFTRKLLGWFVKPMVVGSKPYPKNGSTAPVFVISDERDFATEKQQLLAYIDRVEQDGAAAFEGRESPSFGSMTSQEWSNQFWKHLDHHLRQFGV